MKKKTNPTGKFANLRKRAQVLLSEEKGCEAPKSHEDIKKLVHELDTYQIELELQNEDLRQTQIELEQSQRRFINLYDFAPIGYLTLNDKGTIIEANLTASDLLGVERIKLHKMLLSAFIVHEDQDIFYINRKKLQETSEKQTCEVRLHKKDGNIFTGKLDMVINAEVCDPLGQFRITLSDISDKKNIEMELMKYQNNLEHQIHEKTAELAQAISKLNLALKMVASREEELENKYRELEDINATLRVMLKRRSNEHVEIREAIADDAIDLVLPLLKKAQAKLTGTAKDYVETAKLNLVDIITTHSPDNVLKHAKLAPRELQVVNYIRQGKSTKEIAVLLGLSPRTIGFYRDNIRKKIGIKNQKKI